MDNQDYLDNIKKLFEQNKFTDIINFLEKEKKIIDINIKDYLLLNKKVTIKKEIFMELLFLLALSYLKLNNANNCISILLKYYEINKDNKIVNNILVELFISKADNINLVESKINIFNECIFIDHKNPLPYYKLGYTYFTINNYVNAINNLKLCIEFAELELKLKSYYLIAYIYNTISEYSNAYYFIKKAICLSNTEPSINNIYGVILDNMRSTNLSIIAYNIAINYIDKRIIERNKDELLSEIYTNMSCSYHSMGDNKMAIDACEKSLKLKKSMNTYQNYLLFINYDINNYKDTILEKHREINNYYEKINLKFNYNFNNKEKKIGFISGDLLDHPVENFVKVFYNLDNFYFYSQTFYQTKKPNIKNIKYISNLNTLEAAKLINEDKIDILIDLSGHTSKNRLDIFKVKPAPIQITYVGYPNTTGLDTIDYRITDKYCDNLKTQKYYSEKLLFIDNCFLCYSPPDIYPELKEPPFIKNNYLTLGCFNRMNKITDEYINVINHILLNSNCRIIFKTKCFDDENTCRNFLNKFDKKVINKISLNSCTVETFEHLDFYNNIDIAIDTFPYSGATTSCEALLMGVPTISKKDIINQFHVQNVTSSILINSNLENFIITNNDEYINKISDIIKICDKDFKKNIRNKFLNGFVCNKNLFINNFMNLLTNI
jgi:tetratricopeptide (TPR) repeat protein